MASQLQVEKPLPLPHRHRPGSTHFLLELYMEAEEKAQHLQAALTNLARIESHYNQVLVKAGLGRDDEAERRDVIASLQKERDGIEGFLDVDDIFDELSNARRRFELASKAYEIGGRYNIAKIIGYNLRTELLKQRPKSNKAKEALERLAAAVKCYVRFSPSDINDRRIRAAWRDLEPFMANS